MKHWVAAQHQPVLTKLVRFGHVPYKVIEAALQPLAMVQCQQRLRVVAIEDKKQMILQDQRRGDKIIIEGDAVVTQIKPSKFTTVGEQ